MYMRYGKWKKPNIFGGGQRSSGVTGGQNLKTSVTQYLKLGKVDQVQTWCADVLWWRVEGQQNKTRGSESHQSIT